MTQSGDNQSDMLIKWTGVYNRLWLLIDAKGVCYFSGPRFLNAVREVSFDVPPYRQFIEERQSRGKSTSRHDFFYDVLMELDESTRWRAVNAILGQIDACAAADQILGIRAMLGGTTNAPTATIPSSAWNAERLNDLLAEIDAAIAAGQHERAVSLSCGRSCPLTMRCWLSGVQHSARPPIRMKA